MSGKYALIIGNSEYTDPGLAQLTAPGKDAEDFARVLKSEDICAFDDVTILLNEPSFVVSEAIDAFFYQKKPDDLLIVYFSGHGVRDEFGILYLAVKNTNRARLRATAIRSDYIREAMDQSRSKRQVIVLDCCNSGAFSQGTKAEVGGMMGMVSALQGYGRFVLTASDSTQFAWEGNKVIGETDNSLFTHFLVKGLEGEADRDSDGKITVDELYDYAYDQISKVTPKQTPTKSSSKVEGEIVLRQFARIEDIKPVALPDDLISEIEDLRPYVREIAVQKLERILKGKNIGMARSAREVLERISSDDDSRRVSRAATQVLEFLRQEEKKAEEEQRRREEAEEERLAREKAEREAAEREAARLKAEREAAEFAARKAAEKAAKEKAEKEAAEQEAAQKAEREAMELAARKKVERKAAEEATYTVKEKSAETNAEVEANSISINRPTPKKIEEEGAAQAITGEVIPKAEDKNINKQAIVIWIILGTAIGGAVGGVFAWAISGAICGLSIAIALQTEQMLSTRQNLLWIVLAWSIGGIIGWQIDFRMPIGGFLMGGLVSWTIGGLITAIILRMEQVLSQEQSTIQITLGWAIAGAIGWLLGGSVGQIIGWGIGWGIGGAIGGSVMVWNIKRRT